MCMAVVFLALLAASIDAKIIQGELKTQETWAFLARFCFLSMDGQFSFEIEYDLNNAVYNLLLYYDTSDQWPSVYGSGKSCQQKESILQIENNQIVNLTTSFRAAGCNIVRLHGDRALYRCSANRSFRTARERWWYIAVSNCQSTRGLNLRYRFLMTNGEPGEIWFRHFSADEFYILQMLIGFTCVQLVLCIVSTYCGVRLRKKQMLHSTYKLFAVSVYCQFVGLLFLMLAYTRYAYTGYLSFTGKSFGRIMEALSEWFLLLVLILLGKGFTVTRGRLRAASLIKITAFMSLYTVTYIALFTYERLYFDPGKVLYMYESPAGYGLLVLRLVGWGMFSYATAFTLKHYPEKNGFYLPFFFFASLWFVSGPVIIIIANHIIDKWVREKSMMGVEHSVILIGHLSFLVLTRPSAANRNFPYHVRTSQIGVMVATEEVSSPLDHFPHHTYAVHSRNEPHALTPDVAVGVYSICRTNLDNFPTVAIKPNEDQ